MKKILIALGFAVALTACSTTQESASTEMKDAKTTAEKTMTDAKGTMTKKMDETKSTMTEAVTSTSLTCTNGDDVRTIAISNPEMGGCSVEYTKFGSSTNVANAKNDVTHCSTVLNKIKTNLESASFTCQ